LLKVDFRPIFGHLVKSKKKVKKVIQNCKSSSIKVISSDESESTFSLFHLFTCTSWKVKKFLHNLLMRTARQTAAQAREAKKRLGETYYSLSTAARSPSPTDDPSYIEDDMPENDSEENGNKACRLAMHVDPDLLLDWELKEVSLRMLWSDHSHHHNRPSTA
jgi:hypothetical protein